MTVAEFYVELAAATKRRRVQWCDDGGQIRAEIPAGWVCPITFVCFVKTKEFYPTGAYVLAARALGLTQWFNIVCAADEVGGSHRTRLLKAVGLEEL